MDKVKKFFKKNKFLAVVIMIGLALMVLRICSEV